MGHNIAMAIDQGLNLNPTAVAAAREGVHADSPMPEDCRTMHDAWER